MLVIPTHVNAMSGPQGQTVQQETEPQLQPRSSKPASQNQRLERHFRFISDFLFFNLIN